MGMQVSWRRVEVVRYCKAYSPRLLVACGFRRQTLSPITDSRHYTVNRHLSMSHEVKETIVLTDQEQELFAILLAAAKHAGTGTVLRAAGGWVRDKLLGKESLDIDIALDNALGKDFAVKVNEFLSSQGLEVAKSVVIQSNPDQSKHLETARMKLNGVWIDLVNLRSETYTDNSRIPSMIFGTPEQDALRRDFTVNSLFYNLNEKVVEDYSQRGLSDLRQGLIRTPLPASETFLDDPLRVLRAVRFATRFGFDVDEELVEAASSVEVRNALASKVSRERVGTELEGMVHGPDPVAAVKLLHNFQLFNAVFSLPKGLDPSSLGPDWGAPCTSCIATAYPLLQTLAPTLTKDQRRVFLLAALTLPLRHISWGQKKAAAPLTAYIVKDSIKWRVKDADSAILLHNEAKVMMELYSQLQGKGGEGGGEGGSEGLRVGLGLSMRRMKELWRLGVMLAPLLATQASHPLSSTDLPPLPPPPHPAPQASELVEIARTLFSAIEGFSLTDCHQWKPLLDGKQAMAAVGMSQPGPKMAKLMGAVTEWHLAHPGGTAEQCTAFLLDNRAAWES